MTDEQKCAKSDTTTTVTEMSTIKFKTTSGTLIRQKSKEKDIAEEDDDIAVCEHPVEPKQLHLSIPMSEREIPQPPIFRIREPRPGPSLRPRASKRSTMTWPGCR